MHRLLIALIALVGCVSPTEYTRLQFADEGLQKAAFDLHCEQSQLTVVVIADASVGVRGCGREGRYEYIGGGTGHGTWIANTVATENRK